MFNTSMVRRIVLVSGLAIGSSALFPMMAKADTDGGTVSGQIQAINNVVYTAPSSVTLDPTAGNSNMSFGSVFVQNNDDNGWTLTVQSANSGKLSHSTYGDIAYTGLSAGGTLGPASLDVSGGSAVVYDPTSLTCADAAGCTITLTANVANSAIDGMAAGVYTDTLTFTLADK